MINIKFLKNKKGLKRHAKRSNPFEVNFIYELFLIIRIVQLTVFLSVKEIQNNA